MNPITLKRPQTPRSEAFKAELLKLLGIRSTWWLALATVLLPAIIVSLRIGLPFEDPVVEFASLADRLGLLAVQTNGSWMFVALGALLTAGEWRHRSATTTFLVQPRRLRLLISQIVVSTATVAITAVLGAGLVRVVAEVLLAWKGAPHSFGADQWSTMIGAVLASALFGAIGAALGAVVRNAALAAVAVAAGSPLLDFLTGLFGEGVADTISLTRAAERIAGDEGVNPLQLTGFTTLAAWLLVTALVAGWRTGRADITS